jgi:uncharacterized protein (DUF934 family)
MPKRILSQRKVVDDPWTDLAPGETPSPAAKQIVTLADYLARKEAFTASPENLGLRVPSDTNARALSEHLPRFGLIAVEFPGFKDGRGFTIARLLRIRFGYRGEIRAVGYVMRDWLFYMSRVGFTQFDLAPGKSLEDALASFDDFSVVYQPAEDEALPLWKRRRQTA